MTEDISNVYMTDLGEVRIGEREACLIKIVDDARRFGHKLPEDLSFKYYVLMRDIRRVAEVKYGS